MRSAWTRMKARRTAMPLAIAGILLGAYYSKAQTQDILKKVEPGIGYSQFKQWAIDNQLVFEGFTKDSMIVRDTGMRSSQSIRIQIRFCGGDDYSGRASTINIQQRFQPQPKIEALLAAVTTQRDYVEFLAGKADPEGKFSGVFNVRRDQKNGSDGLAIIQDTDKDKGHWEVGLFKSSETELLLQTIRRKDSICK